MINKQTIISAYDEKLTLLQWLKLVNKALDEAVLTNVEIKQRGNATFVFVFTFEDGTKVESNEIIVNKGDSVNGATIKNGHLYLSLTNGDELDAGNVKPVTSFEINASQHLIVNYGDGTSQDLGSIFSGNVNIDGNFTANSIIEKMNGYSFDNYSPSLWTPIYVGAVKNGNKLTIVISGTFNRGANGDGNPNIAYINLPSLVAEKLFPWTGTVLEQKSINFQKDPFNQTPLQIGTMKDGNALRYQLYGIQGLAASTDYYFRLEQTFLLSDSLAV